MISCNATCGRMGTSNAQALRSNQCFCPVFVAAAEGNLPIVRKLVEAKADVNHRLMNKGTNSLEAACLSGHVDICEYLLNGAELHGASKFDGSAPIHKAAGERNLGVLNWILDKKGNLEECRRDQGQMSGQKIAKDGLHWTWFGREI